jgi:hypothetical protein
LQQKIGTTISLQSLTNSNATIKSQILPSISTLSSTSNSPSPNAAKTLFASNANSSGPILSITTSSLNSGNIQQAVPIINHQSANTSFAQVLRQFSAVQSGSAGSPAHLSMASSETASSTSATSSNIQIVSLPSSSGQSSLNKLQPSQISISLQPNTTVSSPQSATLGVQIVQQQQQQQQQDLSTSGSFDLTSINNNKNSSEIIGDLNSGSQENNTNR